MKAPAINSFIRFPRLIDPSFVHDLWSDHDSEAVIRAVAGLGASLGIATTGEWVATREDLDYLRKEGFTEARRHFFGPPQTGQSSLQNAGPVNKA
jgi:EAL domain-containing protein (putative c-di-GMP-specific phosphodiesterase class I)